MGLVVLVHLRCPWYQSFPQLSSSSFFLVFLIFGAFPVVGILVALPRDAMFTSNDLLRGKSRDVLYLLPVVVYVLLQFLGMFLGHP